MSLLAQVALIVSSGALVNGYNPKPKPASSFTIKMHTETTKNVDFTEKSDFEMASRGLVYRPDGPIIIKDAQNVTGMDNTDFDKLYADKEGKAPPTVNPSAWRHGHLLSYTGIFKVVDKVYQARNYDVAVMTIIEAPEGLILFDPLTNRYSSRRVLDDYLKNVAPKTGAKTNLAAIVFSHSHADHYGGVLGVADAADIRSGKITVVGPRNFDHESLSEAVMVGGSMLRRTGYQFGKFLKFSPTGLLHSGVGPAIGNFPFSFAPINLEIKEDTETHMVAGLKLEFFNTPNTEAPSEFHVFIEKFNILNCGENALPMFHNILTPRGAKIRDASVWSKSMQNTIDMFGNRLEILIGGHNWPIFGKKNVIKHLENTRDIFKVTHDQTVRLINLGFSAEEISETVQVPDKLDSYFGTRGHYATTKHNTKGVMQFYVGWFSGNPAEYQRLPPVERGHHYVADMGGAKEVMKRGKFHLDNGNYRWCMEIMNYLVYSEPTNMQARYLMADCMEQYGYQEESGIRRNYFLSGVVDLRDVADKNIAPYVIEASYMTNLPLANLLISLEVVVLPDEAIKHNGLRINLEYPTEKFTVFLSNGVMHSFPYTKAPKADATLKAGHQLGLVLALQSGKAGEGVTVTGDKSAIAKMSSIYSKDTDVLWNIVTPRKFYTPKPINCLYPKCKSGKTKN